jgi:uncharacterized repeat protein (TIGR03847 family)
VSEPWDLDCDHFGCGAIGPPGQRVFFLQGGAGGRTVTLRCEKQHVAVLAQYLARLVADLPTPPPGSVPAASLAQPVQEAFTLGTLSLGYDPAAGRIVMQLQELVEEDETGEQADWTITPVLAHGFIAESERLLAAGRPACVLCGRPEGPDGHTCVKTNGHMPR